MTLNKLPEIGKRYKSKMIIKPLPVKIIKIELSHEGNYWVSTDDGSTYLFNDFFLFFEELPNQEPTNK